ncbi:hypothetical protein RND81_13G025700 [Saponaria officinalis]|uniref:Uncharacterized protein n=1 Tax=Saponaria officinalis TaxID=3572 RepID=A0AAW1GT45_SAPOF
MAAPPMKSPLHDFPLTFLKWSTKKDRRCTSSPPPTPPPPSSPPYPVGPRSSRLRKPDPEPDPEPEPEEVEKQWNLRPRRRCGGGASTAATAADAAERDRLTGVNGVGGGGVTERREKKRFWISLSKDEIEEDIFSLTGAKPSRRPKKRPKIVQKHLDNVFPGLWLVGLTPDSYRNFDPPPLK